MSFISELKRRNVFRVATAYVLSAWLLIEVSATLEETLHLPEWADTLLAFFMILGFPVALFFSWAYEVTPEGIRSEKELPEDNSARMVTGRKLNRVIVIVMAIAIGWFAWDRFVREASESETLVETAETTKDTGDVNDLQPPPLSIAVLPFVNMSSDPEQEYFAEGISEELLNSLARVNEFKVAGRTSSFAFKGRNEDLRLIGDTLGVTHILEGSVRKAGEQVRITAQLIQTHDGFHQWSDTWDRELTNIFAIQDEIAREILGELKATLINAQSLTPASSSTRAYENYLLARQRIYMRTQAGMLDAAELLEEAVELDPEFAPAWAQLAVAYYLHFWDENVRSSKDWLELARRNAEKSLELDPGLAEGWAVLGLLITGAYAYDDVSWVESEQIGIEYLEKARAINPSLIDANNWLQNALRRDGRIDEALAILEETFQRDPLYPPVLGNLIGTYMPMGRWDEAQSVLEKVRPLRGDQWGFKESEAAFLLNTGAQAQAFLMMEPILLETSLDEKLRAQASLSFFMFHLAEFVPLVKLEEKDSQWHVWALARLGQADRATRAAYEAEAQSSDRIIELLSATGQQAELVAFIETRWGNVEDFASSCCNFHFGFGEPILLMAAMAYRETGDFETFERLMTIVRASHDRHLEQGANWYVFWYVEALYWTLAGDDQRALDLLQKAVDAHLIVTYSPTSFLGFEPLEGRPRFEAIRAQMQRNLDHQRKLAGLEKLGPGH